MAKGKTNKNNSQKTFEEEFKVKGGEIVTKVKELIKEGNARRIIIKNDKGKVMLEVPLTLGVVGAALAPVVAAIGALAALVSSCSIVVERIDSSKTSSKK